MITASDKAIEKLRQYLIDTCFKTGLGFRIVVTMHERGEPTFTIRVDKQCRGDEVMELGNVKAFLNSTSASRIGDYQLDYIDKPDKGFVMTKCGQPS